MAGLTNLFIGLLCIGSAIYSPKFATLRRLKNKERVREVEKMKVLEAKIALLRSTYTKGILEAGVDFNAASDLQDSESPREVL